MERDPQALAKHLLTVMRDTVKNLPDKGAIDSETVLLGLAQTMGDLLSTLPAEAQRELVPEILERIVSRVRGGKLLVMRVDKNDDQPLH